MVTIVVERTVEGVEVTTVDVDGTEVDGTEVVAVVVGMVVTELEPPFLPGLLMPN
jgi:hypothetical protein